jgi:hypothetical protein
MHDTRLVEWGPAAHQSDNPYSVENVAAAVAASLDQRDDVWGRPDDN